MEFEWDPSKAELNFKRHGVPFHEAATVFEDHLAMTVLDPDHSLDEERYVIVGFSDRGRPLIVSHTERGDHIRIISARELTHDERKAYEEGNFI